MRGAREFRDDLLARINLWTFQLPGLKERVEDIEPNLDYELEQFRRRTGSVVTFSKEARERVPRLRNERARRHGQRNFRDLNAVITRLATLAPAGRITVDQVRAEVSHLRAIWSAAPRSEDGEPRGPHPGARNCRRSRSLRSCAARGCAPRVPEQPEPVRRRTHDLRSVARAQEQLPTMPDRLRKYLARFSLEWGDLKARLAQR